MKRFSVPLSDSDLHELASCFDRNGVVIIPTDTVYGVAARPDRPDAVAKIRQMKKRDLNKPMQLLASSAEAVKIFPGVIFENRAKSAAEKFWPGPLTLVLDTPDGHTEGVRVPDDNTARAICACAGNMLRCTSANKSGDPPALDADAAAKALPNADAIVDGGPVRGGKASTVASVKNSGVTIFRHGPVDEKEL